jgi:hypothetical protein
LRVFECGEGKKSLFLRANLRAPFKIGAFSPALRMQPILSNSKSLPSQNLNQERSSSPFRHFFTFYEDNDEESGSSFERQDEYYDRPVVKDHGLGLSNIYIVFIVRPCGSGLRDRDIGPILGPKNAP